jgi:hypothetical protein
LHAEYNNHHALPEADLVPEVLSAIAGPSPTHQNLNRLMKRKLPLLSFLSCFTVQRASEEQVDLLIHSRMPILAPFPAGSNSQFPLRLDQPLRSENQPTSVAPSEPFPLPSKSLDLRFLLLSAPDKAR